MRILVIEDEKRLAFTLADMIGGAGYYTDVSHDGAEGLELAQTGIYDAIVLDVMLPGMDGYAVLKKLKKHPQHDAGAHADCQVGAFGPGEGIRCRSRLLSDKAICHRRIPGLSAHRAKAPRRYCARHSDLWRPYPHTLHA